LELWAEDKSASDERVKIILRYSLDLVFCERFDVEVLGWVCDAHQSSFGRNRDLHLRAYPFLRLHRDHATKRLNKAFGDEKTKPCALFVYVLILLGQFPESLEYAFLIDLAHSDA
jgi:hypothetical protein